MSLKALCEYSSESEAEEYTEQPAKKQKRLPKPVFSDSIPLCVKETHIDDQDNHSGKIRIFPHERGNWASLIYFSVPNSTELQALLKAIKRKLTLPNNLEDSSDFHISLSKTFVLKYHWLETFATSLKDHLKGLKSISVTFENIKIYCNDQKTRTFIALAVSPLCNQELCQFVKKVDKALLEFDLPAYYQNPSFHLSILWVAGDQKEALSKQQSTLENIFEKFFKSQIVEFREAHLKTGNKYYHFQLED